MCKKSRKPMPDFQCLKFFLWSLALIKVNESWYKQCGVKSVEKNIEKSKYWHKQLRKTSL